MNPTGLGTWIGDWVWGLPLIVLTVVIHVCGLAVVGERVDAAISGMDRHRFILKFARVMGATALLATMLHGFEAFIWASAYRMLGALPNNRTAMLYSLGAMTTFGHANLFLQDHWQMMGALEALNGMLLFGLTTAFMFGMMQKSLAVKS